MSNSITCPQCDAAIEITEVMSAQLATQIRAKLQAEYAEKAHKFATEREEFAKSQQELQTNRAEFAEQVKSAVEKDRESLIVNLRAEAEQTASVEIADRDQQLTVAKARLKEFESQELDLRCKTRELEQRTEQQALEVARQVDAECEKFRASQQAEVAEQQKRLAVEKAAIEKRQKTMAEQESQFADRVKEAIAGEKEQLLAKARQEAEQAAKLELKDRDDQIADAQAQVKQFQSQELELRKKTREVEQQMEQQALELARKLDEERGGIRAEALKQADEQSALKLAERDQKIDGLAKQLKEAQRRLEQGSQQTQGDVQEIALAALLEETFPHDVIERIGKGVNGSDVLHHVFDHNGRECGTILWESKRTKTFDSKWIGKAIADQQEAQATCVCLVSSAMPNGVDHIGEANGVWIAAWPCAKSAALVLRSAIIEAGRARVATEGQHGKMELVYNYLSGPEFSNRVRGLLEPYADMEKDLQSEMRAWHGRLKKRRKQLDRAMMSITGLYGDLQGIIGSSLQEIEGMDMLALGSDSADSTECTPDVTD